jgi:hypothetical protein
MVGVVLTVVGAWLVLAVLSAFFVAALGRGGLREDQALGHLAVALPEVVSEGNDGDGEASRRPVGVPVGIPMTARRGMR